MNQIVGATGGSPTNKKPSRKQMRLKGYDYSTSSAYFITTCCHEKKHIFGHIEDAEVHLNEYGKVVKEEWLKSAEIRKEITLDTFIIMPNHIHAIVMIAQINDHREDTDHEGDPPVAPTLKKRSLGALVAGFKQATFFNLRKLGYSDQVWQRGYFEHIIRNMEDYYACQNYINTNPQRWGRAIYSNSLQGEP